MCGLAGYFCVDGSGAASPRQVLEAMADAIRHRGPDDGGVWFDAAAGIGLAHRRLSIIDLSPTGHQPMVSASGRLVIVFNGEIYNHVELRRELEATQVSFRGTSDTEVLLEAIERWGLEATLRRAIGMFALAVWDRHGRTLQLARDRMGEKPLYYGLFGGTLLFGSELKALRAHSAFTREIDRSAVSLLLRHDYIPAPWTIYRHVRKLEPGVVVLATQRDGRPKLAESRYWSLCETAEAGMREPMSGPPAMIVDEVGRAVRAAVGRQMVADVPVGAFLSGGVDSSLTVAVMQSLSNRPVRTFTIGFWDPAYDEAPHARAIARHLGTEHTDLHVTASDALAVIPRLPTMYDEPFADSSQIPTFLVSQLARASVTVSLSGDAGDELFAGYGRYAGNLAHWEKLGRWPLGPRAMVGRALQPAAGSIAKLLGVLPGFRGRGDLHDRLLRRLRALSAATPMALYRDNISYWLDPSAVVRGAQEPATVYSSAEGWPATAGPLQRMMYADSMQYLPDDILVKVDRAAMAVSLETRVPLLDPELIELAWRVPAGIHRLDGAGKWVLRQLLERHVPRALFDRPKMGFAVPLAAWLRVELKDWAEALLDARRLQDEGFFDAALLRSMWQSHTAGLADWSFQLWGVLMFQAWLEQEREA